MLLEAASIVSRARLSARESLARETTASSAPAPPNGTVAKEVMRVKIRLWWLGKSPC